MLTGNKVDKKLNLIKQFAFLAQKVASRIMAFISRNVARRSREVVILHQWEPNQSTGWHLGITSTRHEDGHTGVSMVKDHQDDQGQMHAGSENWVFKGEVIAQVPVNTNWKVANAG